MLQHTDEELVVLIQTDPSPARYQDELFRRHYDRVALWCLRYTGDRDAALDAAQEVFLRVQKGLRHFAGQAKFSTWLFTIARNYCFNELSRTRRQAEVSIDAPETAELANEPTMPVDEALSRAEQLQQAREWMTKLLSEEERQAYSLHYGEGIPISTVTRLLGLSNPSGAKAHLVSARRKLSEAVRRWKVGHETP